MIMSSERCVILKKIIALAKERREVAGDEEIMTLSAATIEEFYDSEKHQEERQLSSIIYEYLMELPFEEVKFVQTMMYMGRDESLEDGSDAERLYREVYASLHWETQEVEAKIITEKMPLDEYLCRGMGLMAALS